MFSSFFDWLVEITNLPVFTAPAFGIFQLIDILIVATVLYLLLKWIRRTQAWVLFRGIVFIALVALLAEVFNLGTVQWIVSNTIGMGLVVVIILFQPELRKALEQLGRGQYFITLKSEADQNIHSTEHCIDQIIIATKTMSSALTGALIVVEQDVDISEHQDRGTFVDAAISVQLLLNIFEKNAPLHDGAMIIRNNRIAAASCILPLTGENVDATLGTRHRAAIGITEVSDAIVVVVSEETGTISLVSGGEIQRGASEADIREMLTRGEPSKARFSIFDKLEKIKRRQD